ncbi:PepSY-associated TM helix domain-containing protein [Leptolyngbya sp. 7M]|uniref:PepSY-associated TM helix domain-containing protein n=1 Tax=Leptolyngbya sp. 7M TaxID=2812896 RepID=UPI001B8C8E08|nr:PepSY-associated TM helix domain-containing protein [Leptolyngbya sp. 7M]QYO63837.1 PepSY domain-containing protein [Leptolyngbya sp. 7M]
MFDTKLPLHKSMTQIHTWAGVLLACILFAVFWTGTLTIFDKEIDRWMQPSLRLAAAPAVSLDKIVDQIEQDTTGVTSFSITMPTSRRHALDVSYMSDEERVSALIDPTSGEALPTIDTFGASDFFFTFHHNLLITWAPFALGTWITSLAAVGMLMLIITGIVIHKKLIADFFTLRPERKRRRLLLDLHNLSSVVALPFHILLPLTALIINFGYFLPLAAEAPQVFFKLLRFNGVDNLLSVHQISQKLTIANHSVGVSK